jgi:uncharacterized RDD family membrane protein YckC
MAAEGGISPIPREARPYQGQRAGVVTRMSAAVIDALVVAAALLLGYVAIAGLRFMIDPSTFSFPRSPWLLNLTVAFVVTLVYLIVGWTVGGRSYGALVMGLRVTGPRGRRLRLPGAFVRALACVLFPVGLLWCAVNPQNRSLQDVLLRTSVVYDWQPARMSVRSGQPPAGP